MKGAIAIAQEHAGGVGVAIRGDDIESAVAVHIAQGHGAWARPRRDGALGLKGAIAIAQEDAGGGVATIRSDHVEPTIAVHIPKR